MSIIQRTATIGDRPRDPDAAVVSGAAITAVLAGTVALLTGVLGLISLGL